MKRLHSSHVNSRHYILRLFITILSFAAYSGLFCFAQLSEADSSSWRGKISSGGTLLTGNVERLLWITTAEISYVEPEQKIWGFKSATVYQYGAFGGRQTENDLVSRNFLYLFPKAVFYPYLMVWAEKNYRRKFDLRYQVGPCVSATLLHDARNTLKISATFSGEQTQFNGANFRERPDLTSSTLNLWRATARVAGRSSLFEGAARIVYEAWYQFGFPIPDDYRYLADASLEIPLSRALSFRLSCSYARDNVALTGVERSDLFLVFGLSFAFE